MGHFLFNVPDGNREQALSRLRTKMWQVDPGEGHRGALAAGDLALIYLSAPKAEFIGRVELATAVRDWTPTEIATYPDDDSRSGVLLAAVEEWHTPVPMAAVVQRIDPTASNPLVQANASVGFRARVVRITSEEYESVLTLRHDHEPA